MTFAVALGITQQPSLIIVNLTSMRNLARLLLISWLLLLSIPSFACVSEDTLCHEQREAIHDITHYRTFVLSSNMYWTGNSSGFLEETRPSDKWDPALRSDGRAKQNVENMIDDKLSSIDILKAEGRADNRIREDHIVNDVHLRTRVLEQLSTDGESIFFVEAKLELYEPVITMHSRQSTSLITWYNTLEVVYEKSNVENAIYDAVEELLNEFSDHYKVSLQYCSEVDYCNSAIDKL